MWTAPDKIEFGPPLDTQINRPKDLPAPTCPKNPPGRACLENLDRDAAEKEKQAKFASARYLYGILFKLGRDVNPLGATTLFAQVKVAHNFNRLDRHLTASRLAKDALEIAEKVQQHPPNKDGPIKALVDYSIELALDTYRSLSKRHFDAEKYERAKANFVLGLEYSTKLLGAEHKMTKDLGQRVRLCEHRMKTQAREQKNSNEDKEPDRDSSPSPRSPSPSQAKTDSGKNGDGEESEDKPSNTSRSKSQDLLNVPRIVDRKPGRSLSTSHRPDGKGKSQYRPDEQAGAQKRSVSVSPAPAKIGNCFDAVNDTGMPLTPSQWAPKVLSADGKTISALKKTHQFLTEERSGYPEGDGGKDRRVRIAVLDTGIDMTQFKGKKKRIKYFCTIPGMEGDGDKDEDGHGSNIVQLIFDIAPEVDVYVWRVFKDTKEVTSAWVAPAIRAAVDKRVDIITMSFGFNSYQSSIRTELKNATKQDILLFAAASNFGGQPLISVAWPAREPGVFCIFATDHEGNKYKHNPSDETIVTKFATFGENIRPSRNKDGDSVSLSGTSFATPIVAATVALYLDFALMCESSGSNVFAHIDTMKFYNSIEALLLQSGQPRDGLMYIKPWYFFQWEGWSRASIAYKMGDVLKRVHGLSRGPIT